MMNYKLIELMIAINASSKCISRGISARAAGDSVAVLNNGDPVGAWHFRVSHFEYRSDTDGGSERKRAYWLERAVDTASKLGRIAGSDRRAVIGVAR